MPDHKKRKGKIIRIRLAARGLWISAGLQVLNWAGWFNSINVADFSWIFFASKHVYKSLKESRTDWVDHESRSRKRFENPFTVYVVYVMKIGAFEIVLLNRLCDCEGPFLFRARSASRKDEEGKSGLGRATCNAISEVGSNAVFNPLHWLWLTD